MTDRDLSFPDCQSYSPQAVDQNLHSISVFQYLVKGSVQVKGFSSFWDKTQKKSSLDLWICEGKANKPICA